MTKTIYVSKAMLEARDIEICADLVNDAPHTEGMQGIEFTRDQLAGQYAADAIQDNVESDDAYNYEEAGVHLDCLQEAGAEFDREAAHEWCKRYLGAEWQ